MRETRVRVTVNMLALIAGLVLATACSTAPQEPAVGGDSGPPQDPIKMGEHLLAIVGCDDCHTNKVMGPNGPELDRSRRLAGHAAEPSFPPPPSLPGGPWGVATTMSLTAWSGPWGISYATNLTPDKQTGIGTWTEAMFVKAIRTGKHMSVGRPILPPMPWMTYNNMTDEELRAIFAYLSTLPPVANKVPEPIIAPLPPK